MALANYRLRVGARPIPAWRTAMTAEDTLYYVTADDPGDAPALTGVPTHYGLSAGGGGSGTAGYDVMSGYSSGTLLESVGGTHGTMVFGTGGHTRIQNQMLGLDLNDDAPTWFWWQEPYWQTDSSNGAELYYNPTEAAALEAGGRGAAAVIPVSGENASGWDRAFPVAFDGWIYPAKLTTGQLGNDTPHGLRFFSVAYVPASVTGSDPVLFAHTGPQGPFAQTWYPDTGSTPAEWVNAGSLYSVGGNDKRKMPFYTRNCVSGVWTEHGLRPNLQPYTYGGLICNCFPDLNRVYCVGQATAESGSTALGYWYADFTAGIGSVTASAWVVPTGSNGGTSFANNEYNCGAWTVGHPDDRHLIFLPDANFATRLIVIDVDDDTIVRVDLASAGLGSLPSNSDFIGMSYEPAGNRIIILLKDSGTHALSYYSIVLPADPKSATGYTVDLRSVSPSVGGMPLSNIAYMYGKTKLHPTLGCILVPTDSNRCMGFVPSAA